MPSLSLFVHYCELGYPRSRLWPFMKKHLGDLPLGKKEEESRRQKKWSWETGPSSLHDPKWSFRIILNWAKMTRPFHSCMLSLWMHHMGKGLNSGAKLSGTQAASEGTASCFCLLQHAQWPRYQVLQWRRAWMASCNVSSMYRESLSNSYLHCYVNKTRVLIALESGWLKLDFCHCFLFTINFIFSIPKVTELLLISWNYCAN